MVATTYEVVDGLVESFTNDVPARHLDCAEYTHHGVVRVLVVVMGFVAVTVVHGPPKPFDLKGV